MGLTDDMLLVEININLFRRPFERIISIQTTILAFWHHYKQMTIVDGDKGHDGQFNWPHK
jgi:hypothetical protein